MEIEGLLAGSVNIIHRSNTADQHLSIPDSSVCRFFNYKLALIVFIKLNALILGRDCISYTFIFLRSSCQLSRERYGRQMNVFIAVSRSKLGRRRGKITNCRDGRKALEQTTLRRLLQRIIIIHIQPCMLVIICRRKC